MIASFQNSEQKLTKFINSWNSQKFMPGILGVADSWEFLVALMTNCGWKHI